MARGAAPSAAASACRVRPSQSPNAWSRDQAQPRGEIGDGRPARRIGRAAHAAEGRDLEQAGAGGLGDARLHQRAQRLGVGHGDGGRRDGQREQQQHPAEHGGHSPKIGSDSAPVSTSAFSRSMKKAPVSGTIRKATGAGPCRPTIACMLAIAVAVAPSAKP